MESKALGMARKEHCNIDQLGERWFFLPSTGGNDCPVEMCEQLETSETTIIAVLDRTTPKRSSGNGYKAGETLRSHAKDVPNTNAEVVGPSHWCCPLYSSCCGWGSRAKLVSIEFGFCDSFLVSLFPRHQYIKKRLKKECLLKRWGFGHPEAVLFFKESGRHRAHWQGRVVDARAADVKGVPPSVAHMLPLQECTGMNCSEKFFPSSKIVEYIIYSIQWICQFRKQSFQEPWVKSFSPLSLEPGLRGASVYTRRL